MLLPKNCLFDYQSSYFQLSKTGPVPSQTLLEPMISSTKLHFCCSYTALCPRLLAKTLEEWADFAQDSKCGFLTPKGNQEEQYHLAAATPYGEH